MEPNIKESVGGLRDSQLLYWIAHTIYGINTIKELVDVVYSEESYKEYRIALELMFRVRSALHLITNKQEDTLHLEYIPSVAKMLGFNDQIKLATKVIAAGWRIDNFTRIYTKKMIRPYLYDVQMISQLRKGRIRKGLYEFKGRIYISYNQKMNDNNELLELLLSLKDKNYKFDSGVLSNITYTKIFHPLSQSTYSLLKQLLQRKYTYYFLKLFYDAGILHELFGNFRKVRHMPQFDGYHHYPVDIHSVECIHAL